MPPSAAVVTVSEDWMLEYAARQQERRQRIEESAEDAVFEYQRNLAEALAKMRNHEEPILVGIGHRDDTPPTVRHLNNADDGGDSR